MAWTKELDEAATLATKSGWWHILLFYLLCGLAAIPTSFLIFSQVFTNATPEHWCAPPQELEALELSDDLLRSLTVPRQHDIYESCRAYSIDSKALYEALNDYVRESTKLVYEGGAMRLVTIRQLLPAKGENERKNQLSVIEDAILRLRSENATACTNGWRYSTEHYERTLVTEFSLFCDKDWLPRTANTLFWVGSVFGNLFFGWMSDRYGRRPTILLMIFLEVPLSIAASFPASYWSYVGVRVVSGLFFPALYQLPFVLALELMPPPRRTYTGIVVGMLFASGMCLLALLAFFFRDWFYLSLATTIPFVFLYGYYWLIPESPRWLVGRGRIAEAEKVLRNLAKKNGIELHRGFLIEIHKRIKAEEIAETEVNINVNGYIRNYEDQPDKDEHLDRRISNMLTFKPDFTRISEADLNNKGDSIERMIALEVAELVNKKARLKNIYSVKDDEVNDEDVNDESQSNIESLQKSTQTDEYAKSPASTFRRKSIQFMNKILIKDDGEEDIMENKRMDEQNSEGDCKASPLDIFRYPNIRKKFSILTFNWVVLGVVYNSLSYNTPNFGVDDYLAFFIGGAVELPSYFIAWGCMERFGRRWVLCVFMAIGGGACLSCGLVPEDWPWVTVSLAMLGRLCIAASFAVFYVQIGELLPTVLRSQAMGAASFIAGLGLLACPYIVYLSIYAKALPLIIMGILSMVGGVTSLFLPETLNQSLPQTLGDGELFGRNYKLLSCVEKPNDV
ncbi:organic cation transporter 1 [Aphomia sociella]